MLGIVYEMDISSTNYMRMNKTINRTLNDFALQILGSR
jgi:hypothetical protein